jgi:hypothetical protein
MNIFFKVYTIKSVHVLSLHAQMVFKFLACLVHQINIKFLLPSLKTLTNTKSCSESRIKFMFRLSIALIGRFILVYIHSWLSEQLLKAQAAIRKPEQAL